MAWKDINAAVYADDETLYGTLNPDGTDGFGKICDKNFEFLKSALSVDGAWDDADPTAFYWTKLTVGKAGVLTGTLLLRGLTSGVATITAPDAAGTPTLTTPTASGTFARLEDKLSAFAATTSAELASKISDETGTGALVFANTPTLVTPVLGAATGTSVALSSFASFGTNPATAGAIRLANSAVIEGRNAGNSADLELLQVSSSDVVEVSNGANKTIYAGNELAADASAPVANGFRIYAVDNGGGKTQLKVIFASGAAQQIAIQP